MKKMVSVTVAVLVLTFLSFAVTNAQTGIERFTTNKYAIANLVAAIKSENPGLRRSAVYFAGKYQVQETVDAIIKSLKNEKSPETRKLIALALYKIGDQNGMEAVKSLAASDSSSSVRKLSAAIYNTYLYENAQYSELTSLSN